MRRWWVVSSLRVVYNNGGGGAGRTGRTVLPGGGVYGGTKYYDNFLASKKKPFHFHSGIVRSAVVGRASLANAILFAILLMYCGASLICG